MRHLASLLAATAAVVACSPTLDWRDFVPEGSGIVVSFPCRPDRAARNVLLVGAKARMEMLACSAGDMTFALAFVDLADPAQVGPVLDALQQIAVANVQGQSQATPFVLAGMTSDDRARRLSVHGHLPDGAGIQEHAVFFARGLRVYQATVVGASVAPAAVENFVAGLKFPP